MKFRQAMIINIYIICKIQITNFFKQSYKWDSYFRRPYGHSILKDPSNDFRYVTHESIQLVISYYIND